MPPGTAQKVVALAAVGLLAVVVGLAIASGRGESGSSNRLPERVGPWRYTRAAPWGQDLEGTTTSCGVRLRTATIGLADPVLPCGAKLYIGFGDQDVLTQVIATGPVARAVRFGLTPALAEDLGIDGNATVRWSYAR